MRKANQMSRDFLCLLLQHSVACCKRSAGAHGCPPSDLQVPDRRHRDLRLQFAHLSSALILSATLQAIRGPVKALGDLSACSVLQYNQQGNTGIMQPNSMHISLGHRVSRCKTSSQKLDTHSKVAAFGVERSTTSNHQQSIVHHARL